MRGTTTLIALLFLTACSQSTNNHWLGYIEGEPALIGAPQPGWITSMNVTRGSEVKAFADHVIAERGVRHGHVVMMPIEPHTHEHGHSHPHGAKSHRK